MGYVMHSFWCCGSETAYPLVGKVYLGRQPNGTASNAKDNRINIMVKTLVQPWNNTGRTVTTDNYFTYTKLSEDLLGDQTTLVRTIRPTRREVPKEPQANLWQSEHSSIFCFDRQLTLVSYVPKKGRAVILLSSMHHDKAVDNDRQQKPEIILYYNDTKRSVDRMDQMLALYSCQRKTKPWPITFF